MSAPLIKDESLKYQLDTLLADARKNQQIHQKFQNLELKVLDADSLGEVCQRLFVDTRDELSIDVITLSLLDPDGVIKTILIHDEVSVDSLDELTLFEDPQDLMYLFNNKAAPIFGSLYSKDYEGLFGLQKRQHGSVILLPLVRRGEIIGSLNIGSYNPRRFVAGLATDFLERFASIVALCVENSIRLGRLKQASLTDMLTGVHNRRSFEERLQEEIARAQRDKTAISCLFVDIDHFKKINDKYGHRIGDKTLKDIASLIRLQLRQCDFVARYGGEEFTVLLPNTSRSHAKRLAERIRKSVESMSFIADKEQVFKATVSIGLSSCHVSDLQNEQLAFIREQLIREADGAVYSAKESGRNCVVVHKQTSSQ